MFRTILVAVDAAEMPQAAALLRRAAELAQCSGATLHAATAAPDSGMAIVAAQMAPDFNARSRDHAKTELAAAIAEAGVSATPHALTGKAYARIIALAEELDADLIVVGAHRPGLSDYLLGSNAARILRHSGRSVLVLRGL